MQQRTRFDQWIIGICSLMMALPGPALAAEYRPTAGRDVVPDRDQPTERPGKDTVREITTAGLTRTEPSPAAWSIADIALHAHGTFVGHVADPMGSPLAEEHVVILKNRVPIGTARTDARGRFAVSRLRGGVYEVSSAGTTRLFRVWAPGTAPPVARAQALIVTESTVVRGQGGPHGSGRACTTCRRHRRGAIARLVHNPWVLATLIGAAIAIPIATSINAKDPPPAS